MATPPDFSVGQVLTAAHMNAVGLWLVKTQTFSAAAQVNVDSVFSSDYDNYFAELIYTYSNTTAETRLQFRAGGANDGATQYRYQTTYVGTALVAERQTASTTFAKITPNTGGTNWQMTMKFRDPNKSAITYGDWFGSADGTLPGFGAYTFNTTTAFTGFSVYQTAGTMTGTVRVYGLRN